MRYENIKTGAVIDSPFPIKGELWVPVDNQNQSITDASSEELRATVLEQQEKIDELEATIDELNQTIADFENAADEPTDSDDETTNADEDEIDLQDLTNKELEKLAKEQGVELTAVDKKNKDARIAAIVAALG